MKEELIKLFDQYMADTVEMRTIEMQDLEKGGLKKVQVKGDLDGFIYWLKNNL